MVKECKKALIIIPPELIYELTIAKGNLIELD